MSPNSFPCSVTSGNTCSGVCGILALFAEMAALKLAIFDLDNTLIAGDSDHSWGEFMVGNGMVDADQYQDANDQFYADYQRGQLDIAAYLNFSLAPLSRYSIAELQRLHQDFMQSHIQPMMLTKASELLERHRQQGDYLLIITSTNDFITGPIAEKLGVDHLLATTAERKADRYTGQFTGTPCYKGGKITRLQQWLENSADDGFHGTLEGASFYSDSINDLPLMEYVDAPVAVDPDEALRQEAQQRQWPIISLR